MIQTVDINALIAKEQMRDVVLIDAARSPSRPLTSNPFADLFDDAYSGLVVSNISGTPSSLAFGFSTDVHHFELFESKNEKTRRFLYDFDSHYLTIEGRKAQPTHFAHVAQFLRRMSGLILGHKFALYFADDRLSVPEIPDSEIAFFKEWKVPFWNRLKKLVTAPDTLLDKLSKRFGKLASGLARKSEPHVSANRHETLQLKDTLTALLETNSHVCITDAKHKNAKLNTVHTMDVKPQTMTYLERNNVSTTMIHFDMDTHVLKINDHVAKDGAFHMVFDKLELMGNLLAKGEAEIYHKDG